jgi:FkbM family methyltransferase
MKISEFRAKIKKHGLVGSITAAKKMGKGYLSTYANRLRNKSAIMRARIFSEDFRVIREIQGSKMLLNLNDAGISQELFFTGIHEPESTNSLKGILSHGMTIVEVGANIGYYALLEAGIIGRNGHIIAFEPSPINMTTFRANIALNGLEDRIETYQMGVGNKTHRMQFHIINKGNLSSFYQRAYSKDIQIISTIEVDVVALDDFFQSKPIKIDFLRMDVEGYEMEIIKGMQNMLKTEKAPDKLFIEIHSSLLNSNSYSCKLFIETLKIFHYEILIARYRGREDIRVSSTEELMNHPLREDGYWEAFFTRAD